MADLSFSQSADPVSIFNDSSGNQLVINNNGSIDVNVIPPSANLAIQLLYETVNSTAVNASEWQDAGIYTVPANYDLTAITFDAMSSSAGDRARIVSDLHMGTYNTLTQTYTSLASYTAPKFASRLYLFVTTLISSANNDTINVTYTNEAGVAGRTTSVGLPKGSLVGTRIEIPLQSGDFGVRSVQNVTNTQAQTGAFIVEGNYALCSLILSTASTQYTLPISNNGIVVTQGSQITLQYFSSSTSTRTRRISLSASLIPR